jgi:hypothetical protein
MATIRPERRTRIAISASFIDDMTMMVFATSHCLKPMNRPSLLSPACPLIARFGSPDRRKTTPVRPRRAVSVKHLICMALSRMIGSNLGAGSMIRPVLPLLQGAAEMSGGTPRAGAVGADGSITARRRGSCPCAASSGSGYPAKRTRDAARSRDSADTTGEVLRVSRRRAQSSAGGC